MQFYKFYGIGIILFLVSLNAGTAADSNKPPMPQAEEYLNGDTSNTAKDKGPSLDWDALDKGDAKLRKEGEERRTKAAEAAEAGTKVILRKTCEMLVKIEEAIQEEETRDNSTSTTQKVGASQEIKKADVCARIDNGKIKEIPCDKLPVDRRVAVVTVPSGRETDVTEVTVSAGAGKIEVLVKSETQKVKIALPDKPTTLAFRTNEKSGNRAVSDDNRSTIDAVAVIVNAKSKKITDHDGNNVTHAKVSSDQALLANSQAAPAIAGSSDKWIVDPDGHLVPRTDDGWEVTPAGRLVPKPVGGWKRDKESTWIPKFSPRRSPSPSGGSIIHSGEDYYPPWWLTLSSKNSDQTTSRVEVNSKNQLWSVIALGNLEEVKGSEAGGVCTGIMAPDCEEKKKKELEE